MKKKNIHNPTDILAYVAKLANKLEDEGKLQYEFGKFIHIITEYALTKAKTFEEIDAFAMGVLVQF